ncbi:hypothetical protein [Streptomyces pacificus]|uniref:Uncharacterized protein n=1 Tax=Streptomyces pacificus TaxID=2705029 RepID=A0A6A0B196_9ACTN|nr:hypothetical protein [Streptomyces pacificus]GFH38886.1 hypothetical protein SCWH03_51490 [Streptomyces pacificus]
MNVCGLCEAPLEDGYLCSGCTLATARRLGRMPKLYAGLEAFLQPGGRASAQYGRTQAVDAPLPVFEPAFSLRGPGGIVGVLEDWRSAMQSDRGWREPAVAGSTERRVAVAARALSMNLDWIAASWPLAGAFAEEIRDLERDVASIVNPSEPGERGRRLGACPAVDPGGAICGAILRHFPGQSAVSCRWCGCTYPPASWPDLKVFIDQDEKEEPWPTAS